MVDRNPFPAATAQDILTVFQFQSYASAHAVEDLGEELQQLAREGKTGRECMG